MTLNGLERLIWIGAIGAVASLAINIPHMLGYDKIYQIMACGVVSVAAMLIVFIRDLCSNTDLPVWRRSK